MQKENQLLVSLTKDIRSKIQKKGRSGEIKHLRVDRNSFLFVNDMTHIRHKKVPPKVRGSNVDPVAEASKWNVTMNHIFNPIIQKGGFDDTNKFVDEQLQTGMSNHYDYIVTQMFRAFLKLDDVYRLDKYCKKVEIANFAESCDQAVMTFKRAYKALYQKQLSDFEFQSSFQKNRRKTQAQAKKRGLSLDGAGSALNQLKGDKNSSRSNLFVSSSESDSEMSKSFSDSSSSSSSSEDEQHDKSKSKKMSGLAISSALDGLSQKNKDKPIMKRIMKRNKEQFDQQINSSKHQMKLAFIQFSFSPSELHEMFKEFHQSFLPSFQITKQEIFTLFEYMCDPKMLGKEKIEEIILPMIGVEVEKELNMFDLENSPDKKDSNSKKGFDEFHLSQQTLKDIWEALCQNDQFVRLQRIMPMLMIFFIVTLLSDIDKRARNFSELLEPSSKVSLVNTFKSQGLTDDELHQPVLKYTQVEQAMTVVKSNYPQSLTFNQIQNILHQVRERMDVDTVSKKEKKQEAFFAHKHITKYEMEEIQSRMKAIQGQMATKLKLMMTGKKQNSSEDPDSKKMHESIKLQIEEKLTSMMKDNKSLRNQLENIKKRDKKDKRYDIEDDNIGFGKWLAYQITIQMMSNKIYSMNAKKQRISEVFENPAKAYQKNFKYFKEERLWWLAMVLNDQCAKEIVNFNAIVKQTLVKKMKQLMPQNFEVTMKSIKSQKSQPSGNIFTLRSMKQPFYKDKDYENTNINFRILFNQLNQNLVKKKQQDRDILLFSMFDYCQVLHQCLQKTVCPWATFNQVEMSVFFFVQNLVHKCESILMEQYECKVLLEHIFDYEDDYKGKMSQSMKDDATKFGVKHFLKENARMELKEKITNRFRRLYGVDSKQEKKFVELCEDKGGNQEQSITQLKELLYANQSCYETRKEYKDRLFGVEKQGLFDINFNLKMPTDELMNAYTFKSIRSQRTLQRKETIAKKKRIDKDQLLDEADFVINNIFRNCYDENTYKKDSEIFGEEFGDNIFSKKSNKYYFKLLQIFGFKDESLISFIDKDKMKDQYFKAKLNARYPEDDFFECFSIMASVENLARFREKRLMTVNSFRQTMLSTDPEVVWNSYFAQAELDKDKLNYQKAAKRMNVQDFDEQPPNETLFDIFNFSSEILMKQFMRYQYRSGLNMLLNYPLDKEKLEMHEKQFEQPMTQQILDEITESISMIINDIDKKQQGLARAKLEKSQTLNLAQGQEPKLTFSERIDIFKMVLAEINEGEENKPKNKDCHACDEDKEHEHKPSQSVLSVFLTSQYYGGYFDQNIYIEKADQEEREKETRLDREKKMKLKIKLQKLKYEKATQEGPESGRVKAFAKEKTKKEEDAEIEAEYKKGLIDQLEERGQHGHGHSHGHGHDEHGEMEEDEHELLHNVISLKSTAKHDKRILRQMEEFMNRKAEFDRKVEEHLGTSDKMHDQRNEKRDKMKKHLKADSKVKFEDYKKKQKSKQILNNPNQINIDRKNKQKEGTFVQQVKNHYKSEIANECCQDIDFEILNSSESSSSNDSQQKSTEREEKFLKYDPQNSVFQAAVIQKKKIKNEIHSGNIGYIQYDLQRQVDFQAMNKTHFERTAKYRPNLSMMLQNSTNKHFFRHQEADGSQFDNLSRLESEDEPEQSLESSNYQNVDSSSRHLDGNLIYNFTDSGRGSDDKDYFNDFKEPHPGFNSKKFDSRPGTLFGSTANNTQKFDQRSQRKKRRRGNKSLATTQKLGPDGSDYNRSFTQSNQNSQILSRSYVHARRASAVNYNPRKWLQDGERSIIQNTPKDNQSEILQKTPKLESGAKTDDSYVVKSEKKTPPKKVSLPTKPQEKRKVLEKFKPVEDTDDFPHFQVSLDDKQKTDDDACAIF